MIYIQGHLLRHAAEKIARLQPYAFTGKIESDDILITLCNTLDVWPRSSRPADEPAVVRLRLVTTEGAATS